jgi:hypothetical protein
MGLVLAGLDRLDQLGQAGEKPGQQGEQQRNQEIRYRISGLALAQILEDRLEGWGTGHVVNIEGTTGPGQAENVRVAIVRPRCADQVRA